MKRQEILVLAVVMVLCTLMIGSLGCALGSASAAVALRADEAEKLTATGEDRIMHKIEDMIEDAIRDHERDKHKEDLEK